MQRLLQKETVPPDGFRSLQPETRVWIRGGDYWTWLENDKAHRVANAIPITPFWADEVEDQLCRSLPPGHCKEKEPGVKPVNVPTRLSLDDVTRGSTAFGEWIVAGRPMVAQAEAERRAGICASCFYNIDIPGCKPCNGALNVIKRIVGIRKTTSDPWMKSCAVCRCFNAVQIWFPAERLIQGTTDKMMSEFPEFCWKAKAIEEFKHVGDIPVST